MRLVKQPGTGNEYTPTVDFIRDTKRGTDGVRLHPLLILYVTPNQAQMMGDKLAMSSAACLLPHTSQIPTHRCAVNSIISIAHHVTMGGR